VATATAAAFATSCSNPNVYEIDPRSADAGLQHVLHHRGARRLQARGDGLSVGNRRRRRQAAYRRHPEGRPLPERLRLDLGTTASGPLRPQCDLHSPGDQQDHLIHARTLYREKQGAPGRVINQPPVQLVKSLADIFACLLDLSLVE